MSFFTDTAAEDNETTETLFFSQKIVSEEEEDEEETTGLRLFAIDSANTSSIVEHSPLLRVQHLHHTTEQVQGDDEDDDLSSVENQEEPTFDEDKGPSHAKALVAPITTSFVPGNTNVIPEQEVLKPLPMTVSASTLTSPFPANKQSQGTQQQKTALQKPSIGISAFTNKKPPFRPIAKPSPATEIKVPNEDFPKPDEPQSVEYNSKSPLKTTEPSLSVKSSGK